MELRWQTKKIILYSMLCQFIDVLLLLAITDI